MKILLSLLVLTGTLIPPIYGGQFPWDFSDLPDRPSLLPPPMPLYPHACNFSAFTVLLIAEQQPRSVLRWINEKVYVDPTALVRVGQLDILLHGMSTIIVSDLRYEFVECPYLSCTVVDLHEEAKAHGLMLEDGAVTVELEWLLKRYELPKSGDDKTTEYVDIDGVWTKVVTCPTHGLLP